MSQSQLRVVPDPDTVADPGGGSGGDDGIEGRLRNLEQQITEVRTRLEYLPTKEDLEGVKTLIAEKESRMLKWLVGTIIAAAATIGVALIRTFI